MGQVTMTVSITESRILNTNYNNDYVVAHKTLQLNENTEIKSLKKTHKQNGALA
jgi:hypothetical protein